MADHRPPSKRRYLAHPSKREVCSCGTCDACKHRAYMDTSISKMIEYVRPKAVVLAEIEKCDVVCSNCHRKKHAGRELTPRVTLKLVI